MEKNKRSPPSLVSLCIESASSSSARVEAWRRQKRTLERLPSHLADSIFRRIHHRRLLFPSLLEVFQYCVEEVDLRGEWSVDAEWMAYLGGFRHLRCLRIADCKAVNNSALWPISGLDSLKELDLSRCSKITDAGIKHILSLPRLEKLSACETGLTADGVKLLSYLTNLHFLDLGGIRVTDKVIGSLQVLTQLEYLDLWGSEVSNEGAATLEMFPRLAFLNLAWTKVTKLPYLRSLACLNLSNCTVHSIFYGICGPKVPLSKLLLTGAAISDIDEVLTNVETSYLTILEISGTSISNFEFLVNMSRLEHLDLSSSGMTDGLIEHVTHIGESLLSLNLSNTKITSQAISILAGHLQSLETLSLSHTNIDDFSLPFIGMITSLRKLDLSHTNLKGFISLDEESSDQASSLRELHNLVNLEELNLEDTSVRDEAIYPLAFFRELKCLYLKSDYLSDIGLHALSSPLPKLRILGFRGAVLTNSGLLLYRPPPMLRMLDLRGSWLLTVDVVSLFRSQHQKIEVKHEHERTLSSDQNAGRGSSQASRSTQASRLRQRGSKLLQAAEVTFVDERIKYSREKMMQLQFSPLASLTLQGLHIQVPTMLRKE